MMSIPSKRLRAIAIVALVAVSSAADSAAAQVATGSIIGSVVDSSGQIVPGAQVAIRHVDRNTTTALVTDANGAYAAPFLVPGTYEVQVTLPGFKAWVRSGFVLQVNDRLRIDATLEVGAVEEVTTVRASVPVVRTDSSEVGTVIEETAIKELPLNGRNFATLVYLVPGITPGQAGENLSGASTFNPRGASNFNALGHQANSNAWLVDGIDNNEFTFKHGHRRALRGTGARVQGPLRRVLGGVRAGSRGGLGVHQVRQQPAARHRVRVAVLPAAHRVHRALYRRVVFTDGTRLPVRRAPLMTQPGLQP